MNKEDKKKFIDLLTSSMALDKKRVRMNVSKLHFNTGDSMAIIVKTLPFENQIDVAEKILEYLEAQ